MKIIIELTQEVPKNGYAFEHNKLTEAIENTLSDVKTFREERVGGSSNSEVTLEEDGKPWYIWRIEE